MKCLKNDKKNAFLIGIAAYAAVILALHIARPGGDGFGDTYGLYLNIVTYWIPIASGMFALRHFGVRTLQGKSILMFTAACISWFVASVAWVYYEGATVSIADFPYFAAYFFIFAGILFGMKIINPGFAKEKKRLAVMAVISVFVMFLYFQVLPVAWHPEVTMLENIATTGYIVADIVILIPTLFLLSQVLSGTFSRPWMAIAGASISSIIADTYYNLNYDTYATGDMVDVMWYFAYLLYAAAFIILLYESKMVTESAMTMTAKAAAPGGKLAGRKKPKT